jgi:hypothetical protein
VTGFSVANARIQPGSVSSGMNALERNSSGNCSRFAPMIVDSWSRVNTASEFENAANEIENSTPIATIPTAPASPVTTLAPKATLNSRMMTICAAIRLTSARVLPRNTAVRFIGLTSTFSNMPFSMSLTSPIPEVTAAAIATWIAIAGAR